jgi:NADH dehydrogenase/NADH:ubiquinone oxidoreductase subunit G
MAEKVVTYTVNGRRHEGVAGASLLGDLRRHGYEVPSLCYHEALTPHYGACRLCLVEVKKGKRTKLTTSCNYPVAAGIEVSLDTDRVVRNRRMVLELLLAGSPRAGRRLPELAERYGVTAPRFPAGAKRACILCGLCAKACADAVGARALTFSGRGDRKLMGAPYSKATACVGCGTCARLCPVEAIPMRDADGVRRVWGRTFALLRCRTCGATTTTAEHVESLVARSGLDRSYFEQCEECRRRETAERFKAVVGR